MNRTDTELPIALLHRQARGARQRPRAMSRGTLAAALAVLATSYFGSWGADGATIALLDGPLLGLTFLAALIRDDDRGRRYALAIAAVQGAVVFAFSIHAPADAWYSTLPLALPALLVARVDFAHWNHAPDAESGAALRRRSSRRTGVIVALAAPVAVSVTALVRAEVGLSLVTAGFAPVVALLAPALVALLQRATDEGDEFRTRAASPALAKAWGHVHDHVEAITHAIDRVRLAAVAEGVPAAHAEGLAESAGRARDAVSRVRLEYDERVQAGQVFDSSNRFSTPALRRLARMRRWGDVANMPSWLPVPLRRFWARVGSWLDVLRIAHTSDLQWVALHGTLWLRAAIVGSAPALGGLMPAGVTPLSPSAGSFANVTWALAAVWAVATAMLSPTLVRAAEDQKQFRVRAFLLLTESPIAVLAVVGAPSFATATFSIGPTNWLQRPDWRLWKLLLFSALVFSVLPASLATRAPDRSILPIVSEVAIAVAVIVMTSSTYGMMLPLLIYALAVVPIRMARLARTQSSELRRYAVREAIAAATDALSILDRTATLAYNLPFAEYRGEIEKAQARAGLSDRGTPLRSQGITLESALAKSLFQVVPPVEAPRNPGGDAGREAIRARSPMITPPLLGDAVLTRRAHTALRLLVKRIALEAARYGQGHLRTRCELVDGKVVVTILNPVAPGRGSGSGTGGSLIEEYVRGLPDGRVTLQGVQDPSWATLPPGRPIYVVRFAFGQRAFSRFPGSLRGS